MTTRLKHRWSLGHNYLAGICADQWGKLLHQNQGAVDPVYWHRALFITLLSLLNSWHARREASLFHQTIEQTNVEKPPIFILGHWRSGTTHLHNLLAQDDSQFAFPNTYQVINPQTFLTTEEVNTRRFAWLLPSKRPMDNMALGFRTPQEDEFAPLLTSLLSNYLGATFPRHADGYEKYLTFAEVTSTEREQWKRCFEWFVKKVTYKNPGRSLLLKSPPHTARIRLLLELFPNAKFVHIHRSPETVFQSFRHYYDTAMWHTYLQKPDLSKIDERILRGYQKMFAAFFADRPLIPEGNFHEIGFADLERNPLKTIEEIYKNLQLPGFESARPKLTTYLATLNGYEKNQFSPLTDDELVRLRNAWEPIYRRWDYQI